MEGTTVRAKGRSGFILLELLPALLIVTGVLIISMRLQGIRLRIESIGDRELQIESAFQAVWRTWQESGGNGAVAELSEGGSWRILDFPDETWIPIVQANGRVEASSASTSVWRRRVGIDPLMGRYWEIGYRHQGNVDWRWWGRVYEDPWGGGLEK